VEAIAPADLAVVQRHGAGDRAEERGLAGAVTADEADPLARFDGKRGSIEQRQVAVGKVSGQNG
jgi:hypothetical protein